MAAQLPNPQIMSQALDTMSTECAKLVSLPALNQGAAILQQLIQINLQMTQMNQRMNQRFNSLEIAIQAMYIP